MSSSTLLLVIISTCLLLSSSALAKPAVTASPKASPQWSVEQAWQWYNSTPWMVGAQYIPQTASNQLEMWQSETWDPKTIDAELGLMASTIKMNSIRVFLHYLPFWYDSLNPNNASEAFLQRIDDFLSIAYGKYKIRTMFTLLDDCWNAYPLPGPQLPYIPHVIGSRWVQNPGISVLYNETAQDDLVKPFVMGVMQRFANDERVVVWDMYNEAGNQGGSEPADKKAHTLVMLQKIYQWAREANVSQPLTSCVFDVYAFGGPVQKQINDFVITNSDIVSFHSYEPLDTPDGYIYGHYLPVRAQTERPIICTEYMARPRGSTFSSILPYAKAMRIGSFNWGFVNGKVQANFPWDSWTHNYTEIPALWFHDIFWGNFTPFSQTEVDLVSLLITDRPTGF